MLFAVCATIFTTCYIKRGVATGMRSPFITILMTGLCCGLVLNTGCRSAASQPVSEASSETWAPTPVTPVSTQHESHPYGLMDIQGKHGKGQWRKEQPLR